MEKKNKKNSQTPQEVFTEKRKLHHILKVPSEKECQNYLFGYFH